MAINAAAARLDEGPVEEVNGNLTAVKDITG